MAKKERNSNPEVERLLRDLYREDVERVSRGESAVYFGHLNDKPLIDEHPEFDWLTRTVPIPVRRPTTRLSLIDDAVDLYERTSRTGATLPEINKRVGEFIRGLGDRMPGAIGSAWRGIFDFSQHSPDKGVAGSAFLPMSVIQREENARREANGEYPLGYVSAVDFIWPREKYGTPLDKRTPEEVRQWEIEHGTRNAAEVELPNVDVYPRDRMDDGGWVNLTDDEKEWAIGETVRLAMQGRPVPRDSIVHIIERARLKGDPAEYDETIARNEEARRILRGLNNTIGVAATGAGLATMGAWNLARLLDIGKGSAVRNWMAKNAIAGARANAAADIGDAIENPSMENLSEVGLSVLGSKDLTKASNKIVNTIASGFDVEDVLGQEEDKKRREPTTGYFNRVRLKKRGGRVYEWTDKDEKDFRDWYARVSEYKGLNPDPDDENQYYDYRTFWKENPDGMADKMLTDDADAHFTDRYKLPGHPTFSNESMYSNDDTPGGSWEKKGGKWYFTPSDYTRRYIDRTIEYLAGDDDNGIYIDGEYRLIPRMDDGGKYDNGWSWTDVEGVLGDAGRFYFVDREKLSKLIRYSPANFAARLRDKDRKTIPDWEDPDRSVSTHKMGWEYGDDGRIYVFPTVQEIDGELKDFSDPKYGIQENKVPFAALESAVRNKDYIVVDSPVEAFWITDNYKTLFPGGKDYEEWGNSDKKSKGGNVGPVKVRGLSARIDTGARPIPISGNYVEDPRRDANSDVSEMERLRDIYDYLRNNEKHKFNEIQALAITANIAAESKGRIDALGKAGDFGLQQWLGVRKNELQRRYGKNPSMEQQLDYLIDEYLGSVNGLGWNFTNRGNFYGSDSNGNKYNYYMYSKKEFDDATSYLDATVAWNQGFGRPLGSTLRNNDRRDIAKRLAEAWGVDDGEYKGYIYGMMGDDGKYEYDPERTQPPIETVVPSQGNNRVDSWWDKNGDDFMRSVLSQAGATRDMMKEMMARAEADEASKREIAKRQAEAERDNLRKQVAMSLVQGMRLDIPGMARDS